MTLERLRAELVAALDSAEKGSKAINLTVRSFNQGHAEGLRQALRLVDRLLTEQATERLRKAAMFKP